MVAADELVSVLVEIENGSTDHKKIDKLILLTKEQLYAAEVFFKTI